MGEISIKINIADRIYPLKVEMEEEEMIRKAAKDINEHIRSLQQVYDVRDKQDLLSMSVLHYATTALRYDDKKLIEDDGISGRISELHDKLDNWLSENDVLLNNTSEKEFNRS